MKIRIVALFGLLMLAGCASAPSQEDRSSAPDIQQASESTPTQIESVTYALDVANATKGYVDVTVVVDRKSGNQAHTNFMMSESWGGVDDLPALVSDVRAVDATGASLEVEQAAKNRWRVEHPPGAQVSLRYRLSSGPGDGPTSPSKLMFSPRIESERIFLVGPVALVTPRVGVRDHGSVDVRIRWAGLPEAWEAASSLGLGTDVSSQVPFGQARRTIMYAGSDVRTLKRTVEGNQLGLVLSGDWAFSEERLADILAQIMRTERDFFRDHSQEFFLVSALPLDLSGTPYASGTFTGGTGLFQSFAMFLVPDTKIETETDLGLKHLLAHELFHNWNGQALVRLPEENEPKVYWFTEGFTEHFTREILLDNGLITRKQYLTDLNDQLRAYQLNPLRDISNAELAERFWGSRKAHELAYQRGAVIALMLDRRIREHTNGEKTLADAMRRLFNSEQPEDAEVNAYLLETFAKFLDEDYVDTLREQVLSGEPVEIGTNALGPCYRRVEVTEKEADWGFDVGKTVSARVVHGVEPDSAAARAGLKNGMHVQSYERRSGEEGTEIELAVGADGTSESVIVRPDWASVTTSGVEFAPDACAPDEQD